MRIEPVGLAGALGRVTSQGEQAPFLFCESQRYTFYSTPKLEEGLGLHLIYLGLNPAIRLADGYYLGDLKNP